MDGSKNGSPVTVDNSVCRQDVDELVSGWTREWVDHYFYIQDSRWTSWSEPENVWNDMQIGSEVCE